MTDLGVRFATALAAKDRTALTAVLAPDVDFKGLTPRRFWEAEDIEGVFEVLFDNWFEDEDHIDGIIEMSTDHPVADTQHVGYRFALTLTDGPHVVEQQAYYRADGDRIGYLRVLCSGMRPVSAGLDLRE
jgi:hypothetical protein